jgi:hypothetical protein
MNVVYSKQLLKNAVYSKQLLKDSSTPAMTGDSPAKTGDPR